MAQTMDTEVAMIPRDQLAKEPSIETVTENARLWILKNGGHRPTVLFACDKALVICMINNLADTARGRQAQMRSAGYATAKMRRTFGECQAAYFVCEAWGLTIRKADLGGDVTKDDIRSGKVVLPIPSESPNRVELLQVQGVEGIRTKTAKIVGRSYEMIRHADTLDLVEYRNATGNDGDETPDGKFTIDSPLLESLVAGINEGMSQPPA